MYNWRKYMPPICGIHFSYCRVEYKISEELIRNSEAQLEKCDLFSINTAAHDYNNCENVQFRMMIYGRKHDVSVFRDQGLA